MRKLSIVFVILLTAILGHELWEAYQNTPPEPEAGTSLGRPVFDLPPSTANDRNSPSAVALDSRKRDGKPWPKSTFRLGSFNIHGGVGLDERQDFDRTTECLHDLDVVTLNEVHGQFPSDRSDQAAQLGKRLDMEWLFAPADVQWYYRGFGNGLLTKAPVAFWQWIPLPRRSDPSYRNMVLANLEFCDAKNRPTTVHLLLTHVNQRYNADRHAQLQSVIAMYLALAEPAILTGDFNSTADDPEIQRLLHTPGVSDVVGEKSTVKMPERIDWIFVRGLRCTQAGIRKNVASDHPLVWAELELPRSKW
ncbi:MAG: endonuclease/exonuclease/phosphatase family protein [Thermoguttaceae bacterium]